MRHHSPPQPSWLIPGAVATALVLLLLSFMTTAGQSGRRLPTSKPVPTPEPTPAPQQKKPADKVPGALQLIVGIDPVSGFDFIPLHFYSTALYSCSDRLDDSPSVEVASTQRDISRGEAVNRARKEKEAYVVWLQLRGENLGADSSRGNVSEIFLEYTLFAPTTAKVKASGRTYQQAGRVGGVIVGVPTSGRRSSVYSEYLIKAAAQDAAERILSALHVPSGRRTLP